MKSSTILLVVGGLAIGYLYLENKKPQSTVSKKVKQINQKLKQL
jgi:hypothetical protein